MLLHAAGYVGGLYVARNYLRDRLEELREKMEVERVARNNLRRRFQQAQEDVSYTVLALLPTLSEQILQTMDLERLINELQARSKTRNKLPPTLPGPSTPPEQRAEGDGHSSLSSSVDLVTANPLPQGAISVTQLSESFVSAAGSVSQSWVASGGSPLRHSRSPTPSASATSSFAESSEENGYSEEQFRAPVLAESEPPAGSVISDTTTTITSSTAPGTGETKSKSELWHEVKILTFTRTLTTLYSISLLCLLTSLQLTLLARSKYVASILEQEREERIREQLEAGLTTTNLVFGSLGLGPAAGSHLENLLSGGSVGDGELDGERVFRGELWRLEGIGEVAESKYLTLSWWLLHVGWKDVRERVRRAVEETFEGVSLKTKIAIMDLHQLISDVRRRVEHEITFEGIERRSNFLSALLPPTPETICHVLGQGGYTPAPYPHRPFYAGITKATESSPASSQLSHDFANSPAMAISLANPRNLPGGPPFTSAPPPPHLRLLDEPFASLLSETRSALSSPDFTQVFEMCLDRATEVLFDSLEKNIFQPSSVREAGEKGEEVRIRLAALLPGLAKWSQLALNGLPNELIDRTLGLREVSCFSAILFSQFEEHIT